MPYNDCIFPPTRFNMTVNTFPVYGGTVWVYKAMFCGIYYNIVILKLVMINLCRQDQSTDANRQQAESSTPVYDTVPDTCRSTRSEQPQKPTGTYEAMEVDVSGV